MSKLINETVMEATNPVNNGFIPILANPFKFTCMPIAAMTIIIKNFATSLLTSCTNIGIQPIELRMLITKNHIINQGNASFNDGCIIPFFRLFIRFARFDHDVSVSLCVNNCSLLLYLYKIRSNFS